MPVVVRSIQILNRPVAVSRFIAALMLAVSACHSAGYAQEATKPAQENPPAPAPDESTPQPAAPAQEQPEQAALQNNAAPVAAGCGDIVEKQNALVRSLVNLQKPLSYPDKATTEKNRRDVNNLIKNGFKGEDTKKVVGFLEYQMLRATDSSFVAVPSNVQSLIGSVVDTVGQAGGMIGNPQEQLAARRNYCGEILKVAKQLLENNFDARLAAVVIISNLHEAKAVSGGSKAKVYEPAIATLLSTLTDKEQPDALKTAVAGQLAFLLRTCDVLPQDQFRICDAISAELSRSCTESGYQLNLLDAALEITLARKKIGVPEPTAMKIFAATLNDSKKPVEVRCKAAYGIGHGVFDAEMKLEPFAWKIGQLAGEVAVEFNQNPNDEKWRECGKDLFFSFWHMNNNQRQGANAKGLLNREAKSKLVSDMAPHIGSVALNVLKKTKFKAADLQPLADLINSSKPANGTWDKSAPPIVL